MSGAAATTDPNYPREYDNVLNKDDLFHPASDPTGATKKPKGKGGPDNTKVHYRGVRQRNYGMWVAEIREPPNSTRRWIGSFTTAEDAARAYDRAATTLYGSRAQVNFQSSAALFCDGSGSGGPSLARKRSSLEMLEVDDCSPSIVISAQQIQKPQQQKNDDKKRHNVTEGFSGENGQAHVENGVPKGNPTPSSVHTPANIRKANCVCENSGVGGKS